MITIKIDPEDEKMCYSIDGDFSICSFYKSGPNPRCIAFVEKINDGIRCQQCLDSEIEKSYPVQ